MNLLLDSHVLLWWLANDRTMTDEAFRAIGEAESVSVSLATPWELQIKIKASKLDLAPDWHRLDLDGIDILGLSLDEVLLAADLPLHHRDPFDRVIIAQALHRNLAVVTRDRAFDRYGLPIVHA